MAVLAAIVVVVAVVVVAVASIAVHGDIKFTGGSPPVAPPAAPSPEVDGMIGMSGFGTRARSLATSSLRSSMSSSWRAVTSRISIWKVSVWDGPPRLKMDVSPDSFNFSESKNNYF